MSRSKINEVLEKESWLRGLSDYAEWAGFLDKYDIVYKGMFTTSNFKMRDLIFELMKVTDRGSLKFGDTELKSYVNTAIMRTLNTYYPKREIILAILAKITEDEFIKRLNGMVGYCVEQDIEIKNFNDFFSRGQVKSKNWLVDELLEIVDGSVGNVVFYGGWYNLTAHFFFEKFKANTIYSVDIDESVVEPSKKLYETEKFIGITDSVENIIWENKNVVKPFNDRIDAVVNTSCEHMDNTWFDNLPKGTFVVLQSNNYFENSQHNNCCKTLEEAKQKYPMETIYYDGELDLQLYTRYMLIGVK